MSCKGKQPTSCWNHWSKRKIRIARKRMERKGPMNRSRELGFKGSV